MSDEKPPRPLQFSVPLRATPYGAGPAARKFQQYVRAACASAIAAAKDWPAGLAYTLVLGIGVDHVAVLLIPRGPKPSPWSPLHMLSDNIIECMQKGGAFGGKHQVTELIVRRLNVGEEVRDPDVAS